MADQSQDDVQFTSGMHTTYLGIALVAAVIALGLSVFNTAKINKLTDEVAVSLILLKKGQ